MISMPFSSSEGGGAMITYRESSMQRNCVRFLSSMILLHRSTKEGSWLVMLNQGFNYICIAEGLASRASEVCSSSQLASLQLNL